MSRCGSQSKPALALIRAIKPHHDGAQRRCQDDGEDTSLRLIKLKVKVRTLLSTSQLILKNTRKNKRELRLKEEMERWQRESRRIGSIKLYFLFVSQWLPSRAQTLPHTPLLNPAAMRHNTRFGLNRALHSGTFTHVTECVVLIGHSLGMFSLFK